MQSAGRGFNGVDQYVDTGIKPNLTGFIECSFNANTIGGTSKIVMGSSDNPATSRCYIAINSDGRIAGGLGADNTTIVVGNSTVAQGKWYTAKLQWDGSNVSLYLNEVLEYTGAQNGTPDTSLNLFIGKSNSASFPAPFNGSIADAKINGVSIPFNNSESFDIASDESVVSFIGNPSVITQDVVHRELNEGFYKAVTNLGLNGVVAYNPNGESFNSMRSRFICYATSGTVMTINPYEQDSNLSLKFVSGSLVATIGSDSDTLSLPIDGNNLGESVDVEISFNGDVHLNGTLMGNTGGSYVLDNAINPLYNCFMSDQVTFSSTVNTTNTTTIIPPATHTLETSGSIIVGSNWDPDITFNNVTNQNGNVTGVNAVLTSADYLEINDKYAELGNRNLDLGGATLTVLGSNELENKTNKNLSDLTINIEGSSTMSGTGNWKMQSNATINYNSTAYSAVDRLSLFSPSSNINITKGTLEAGTAEFNNSFLSLQAAGKINLAGGDLVFRDYSWVFGIVNFDSSFNSTMTYADNATTITEFDALIQNGQITIDGQVATINDFIINFDSSIGTLTINIPFVSPSADNSSIILLNAWVGDTEVDIHNTDFHVGSVQEHRLVGYDDYTNPTVPRGHNDANTGFNMTHLTQTGNRPPAITETGQDLQDYRFGGVMINPLLKRILSDVAEDRHSLYDSELSGECLEKANEIFTPTAIFDDIFDDTFN